MPPKKAQALQATKSKQVKEVILKLPSDILSQFPHQKQISSTPPSAKSPVSALSPTPAATSNESPPGEDVRPESNTEVKSEPTPENNDTNEQAQAESKRKGPGPKPGQKRRVGTAPIDGQLKPRAKPGPKKRKLDGDDPGRPWTTPAAGGAAHKLGPKANQGAINAGLRALDRTGKPCRKWNKSGFVLKSFTGQVWSLHSWATPHQKDISVDGNENVTPNSTSENQPASSNVGSEASHSHPPEMNQDHVTSSPAPVATPA